MTTASASEHPPGASSSLPKAQTAIASLSASISARFAPARPLPVIDELESAGTPRLEVASTTHKPQASLLAAVRLLRATLNLSEPENTEISRILAVLSLATVGRSVTEFLLLRTVARLDASVLALRSPNFWKFFACAVSANLLSQISVHMQSRLSGALKFGLFKSIIANLVLSDANLSQATPLLDAEKLDAVMNDASSLAATIANVGVDRLRKISDLFLYLGLFAAKGNFRAPILVALYLFLVQRFLGRAKKEKISDSEGLRKALVRVLRHRESVKLWNGRDTEISYFFKAVDVAEKSKTTREISQSKIFFLDALAHKVLGTGLGIWAVTSSFLSRKSEISDFLWTSRVMYGLSSTLTGLAEELSEGGAANVAKIHALALKLKHAVVDFPALENRKKSGNSDCFKIHDQSITLCDVTLAQPDGTGVLFRDLSLEIFPGKTLLVSGPRGSGKSALAKIIMGMWTPTLGEVCRPKEGVSIVPQRPYVLAEASLKEQVAYPDVNEAINNDRLLEAIHAAKIQNLFPNSLSKTTSLTADSDQTRLMIARLLYHVPRFALLDDCVRSGGLDAESLLEIVRHLKARGTAVIVFASSSAAETLRARFEFDAELKLNVAPSKQPPRHELLFRMDGASPLTSNSTQ